MNYTDSQAVIREPVNILLVDDQPAKLLTYESILDDLGEKLLKANSGKEALACLLKHDVAVVLMDVCMPEMDGFELATTIRQHPRFQKTAIILVSAINQTDLDRLKGYDCGAMDYISVPVVPEIMRAKVAVFVDLYRKTRDLRRLNTKLQRQAHLLDQSHDAILAWRLDNGIVYWNKAAEQLYGYTASEALGRSSHDLLATQFPDSLDELLSTLKLKNEWAGELIHRHRDGRSLMIESRMRLVQIDTTALVLEANRDISRRKELEREVLDVVAMEQHRIGQELHDGVNQELFALDLITTAMSLRLANVSSAEEAQATKISAGLTRIQRQIRALARGLVPMELDPEGLRAALVDLAERTSEGSGIVCKLERSPAVLIEESMVATHLLCIAQEAVRNAVRHGRARSIRLSLREEAGRVILAIRDDGMGMPATSNKPEGLGIRLMEYRASVIGGWVTIGPAKEGGTVVMCTLPAKSRNGDHVAALKAVPHSPRPEVAVRKSAVPANVDRSPCPTI